MSELKLGKLPDRQSVKIAFKASPELAQLLQDYALAYREAYGQEESIEELVPFILSTFLQSDRGFAKARKDKTSGAGPSDGDATVAPRQRRRTALDNSRQNPE